MKGATPELIALLADSNQFVMWDVFEFVLFTGDTVTLTTRDAAAVPQANMPITSTMQIKRSGVRTSIGLEVDTMKVTMMPADGDELGGESVPAFAINGGFDAAVLTVTRYFAASWLVQPAGGLIQFKGRVADVDVSANQVLLNVVSAIELLNILMPRNPYMSSCGNTLYDTQCGAVAGDFTQAGVVLANSTTNYIVSNLPQADDYFTLGVVEFTSGNNAGQLRSVITNVDGDFTFIIPLRFQPAPGDTFSIRAGCDKRQETCENKFGRLSQFRGFPFIPVPESTL